MHNWFAAVAVAGMMALSFVAGAGSAEVGEPAPPFSLMTADGKMMVLADLLGGVRRADAEQFLQINTARFAVVYDDRGATPQAYSVKGMPSSYLINARGTVVDVEIGFRDDRKGAIEDQIRSLLLSR